MTREPEVTAATGGPDADTTALTLVKLSPAPRPPTRGNQAADVTNGNSVANTGGTILRVKNTGASTYIRDVRDSRSVEGQAVGDDARTPSPAGAVAGYRASTPAPSVPG